MTTALANAPKFRKTNIRELFGNRAYDLELEGTHTRLDTNYTAEQLAPAVEAYKAFTGRHNGPTSQIYSDLAHLLSVYREHCDRGLGCHLSLSQEHYRRVPGRYRAKWETYWYAKYSTERLKAFGLVDHTLGNRWQRKESVLKAGPLLKAFCEHLRAQGIDPAEAPAATRECIIVRDVDTRHPIAFEDTKWTQRARPMLTALNEAQQRQELMIDGQQWSQDPMVMIYAGSLDRAGGCTTPAPVTRTFRRRCGPRCRSSTATAWFTTPPRSTSSSCTPGSPTRSPGWTDPQETSTT